jgi:predicted ABC-class ATPase
MKNVPYAPSIQNRPKDWKSYYLKCEKIKADVVLCSVDLRFLQQLLDRYFDDMVKNEHLDEIRESLIRFQDLCYNCSTLKKRVKDQQSHLINLIKGATSYDPKAFLIEQSNLEKRKTMLLKELKKVKKELLTMVEHVVQDTEDNDSFVH